MMKYVKLQDRNESQCNFLNYRQPPQKRTLNEPTQKFVIMYGLLHPIFQILDA